MRVIEILEARRNPSQNPKTPINDIIINAVDTAPGDIAGIKNLFVSFTSVDKLGINPQSIYHTPLGIYAYPGEYVIDEVGKNKSMLDLPFAGDSEYANIFNASGNIINVAAMGPLETRSYYKKISELWANTSGRSWKTSVDDIEDIINNAMSSANFKDYPGGQLWYVTMVSAKHLFSKAWKLAPHIAWNKLFRSIGIDGVVDYGPAGGVGIIHTSEPSQAVFFTINAIKNVKRYNNRYSPVSTQHQQAHGIVNKNNIATVIAQMAKSKDPAHVLNALRMTDPKHITVIKDNDVRKELLKRQPSLINYLKNPSPELQELVLSINLSNLKYIENPNDQVFLNVIENNPNAVSNLDIELVVKKFPDTRLAELQLIVANKIVSELEHFKILQPKVVKAALDIYTQRDHPHPKWLLKTAKKQGIPFNRIESYMIADARKELDWLVQEEFRIKQEIIKVQNEWISSEKALIDNKKTDLIPTVKKYFDEDIMKLKYMLKETQDRIIKTNAYIETSLKLD